MLAVGIFDIGDICYVMMMAAFSAYLDACLMYFNNLSVVTWESSVHIL